MKTFSYEVISPEKLESTFILTVRVPVKEPKDQSPILSFIRSQTLKEDVQRSWISKNAPNYGMEVRGGPRPVFHTPGDRNSAVLAYEVDFRLSQRL